MADSVVERMALAATKELARQAGDESWTLKNGKLDFIDQNDVDVVAVIRSILVAMHEPTDLMVDAGFDSGMDEDLDFAPRLVWCAMIDEALKETSQ